MVGIGLLFYAQIGARLLSGHPINTASFARRSMGPDGHHADEDDSSLKCKGAVSDEIPPLKATLFYLCFTYDFLSLCKTKG